MEAKEILQVIANVVAPWAAFAGSLTLATQFIIACPDSRLDALLSLASQFFLASLLGLLLFYLSFYGFPEDIQIQSCRQRVILAQFGLEGTFLCIAFVVLVVVIMVSGMTDMDLMGLLVIRFRLIKLSIFWPSDHGVPQPVDDADLTQPLADDLGLLFKILLSLVSILELLVAMVLLTLGSKAVAEASFQQGCTQQRNPTHWLYTDGEPK